MKKAIKIILGVFITVFVGLTIFLLTFDINSYKGKIEAAASEAIGHPVSIGSLQMKLSFFPTIVANNIVLKTNGDITADKPLAQIDKVDLKTALMPLLHKKIEISSFRINKIDLYLVQQQGKSNFIATAQGVAVAGGAIAQHQAEQARAGKNKTAAAGGDNEFVQNMRADDIAVSKINVIWKNNADQKDIVISDVSLKQLKLLKMKVAYDKQQLDITATLDSVLNIALQKPNYAFNVKVNGWQANCEFSGKIGDFKTLDDLIFNASVKGNNLKGTAEQVLNKPMPSVPEVAFEAKTSLKGNLKNMEIPQLVVNLANNGLVLDARGAVQNISENPTVNVAGSVKLAESDLNALWAVNPLKSEFSITGSKQNISIERFLAEAQKSDITVQGTVALQDVPDVNLDVKSTYFSLNDFIKSTTKDASQEETRSSEDSDKIGVFATGTVNFGFDYIGGVPGVDGPFAAKGNIKSTPQTITLTLSPVDIFKGQITGDIKADLRQNPVFLNVNLSGKNLSSDVLKQDVLQSVTLDAQTQLTAKGLTADQIFTSLNGTIEAEISGGKIVSKELNAIPLIATLFKQRQGNNLSFSAADKSIELICGAVKVPVRNGMIALNNQVVLETDILNFVLNGSINLPKKMLDVILVPSLVDAKDKINVALSLVQNIRLAGPFNKPEVSVVDGQQLLQQGLKVADAFLNKEKRGQQTTTVSGAMCQKVLGRSLKKTAPARKAQPAVQEVAQPTPKPTTPELKEQLFDALTKALK